jgi:hypothetical protein
LLNDVEKAHPALGPEVNPMSKEALAVQETPTAVKRRRPTGRRAVTVALAVVATVIVWTIADPVLGTDLKVKASGGSVTAIGLGSVIFVTLLSGLVGWGTLALLERLGRSTGRRIWTIAAAVVLVLSLLLGPTAGIGGGAKISLALLHITAGLVIIFGLTGAAREG